VTNVVLRSARRHAVAELVQRASGVAAAEPRRHEIVLGPHQIGRDALARADAVTVNAGEQVTRLLHVLLAHLATLLRDNHAIRMQHVAPELAVHQRAELAVSDDAGHVDDVPVKVVGDDRARSQMRKLAHAAGERHADPLHAAHDVADVGCEHSVAPEPRRNGRNLHLCRFPFGGTLGWGRGHAAPSTPAGTEAMSTLTPYSFPISCPYRQSYRSEPSSTP
jgi:hypothetical protein